MNQETKLQSFRIMGTKPILYWMPKRETSHIQRKRYQNGFRPFNHNTKPMPSKFWITIIYKQVLLPSQIIIQEYGRALAGMAQWIECQPAKLRVAGSPPGQGTCLRCTPSLWFIVCKRQSFDFFLKKEEERKKRIGKRKDIFKQTKSTTHPFSGNFLRTCSINMST